LVLHASFEICDTGMKIKNKTRFVGVNGC
jgi:hypothetical protein